MSNAQELTSSNFDQAISNGVTLVDFWAEWCGPCRMMTPIIDQLAEEYKDKAKIAKLNVDNEGEVAAKYQVMSIPTLIVFRNGQMAKRFVGVTSKSDLAAALESASSAA